MSGRIIGRSIINRTTDLILEDARWAQCWAQYLRAMENKQFPLWYIDMVGQRPDYAAYTLYDAYCFSQIHTMLHTGALAWAELYIGTAPRGDLREDINNQALQFEPSSPFRAKFVGGTGTMDDGYLTWTEPIALPLTRRIDITEMVTVHPRRVPLEVGYTESTTTLDHVLSEYGVARWPYDSKSIWLLVAPDIDCDWGAEPDPEPVIQLSFFAVD